MKIHYMNIRTKMPGLEEILKIELMPTTTIAEILDLEKKIKEMSVPNVDVFISVEKIESSKVHMSAASLEKPI